MEQRHSLTRYTILLAVLGLALNLALSKLALHFALPLYLDSVGTILAAVLGGYFPGIVAGFFANAINGLSDPITFFYSIISVLIAVSAASLAKRGSFSNFRSAVLPRGRPQLRQCATPLRRDDVERSRRSEATSGRSPVRNRDGLREDRAPGVLASDQDTHRCTRARVLTRVAGITTLASVNSTPWDRVTAVASSTLMSSTFQICCSTEPRSSRNSLRPEGRSRTIMVSSVCSQAAGAVCMLPVCR